MNMTKKINVNYSSLVGLKAELLRKQAEVNEVKLKTEHINKPSQLNKKRSKKIPTEGVKKNTKELIDSEDIIAHKKSRLMLEAKTRLYERLKKSKNNNDKFLVDFKNKLDESDEEFVDEAINEEHPIEPDENWVEYKDCFGRTRKCLREDLPHMQKKDELIKQEIMKGKTDEDGEEENKEQYPIQEKEPEIEIMRRKWEEQTQKLADKVDIHYQDILFDEARTHGVGYYAFSQDEEERAKQQENLASLRKETERKQREMKEVKELKERMEQNRLKVARMRQRIRAGLPAELTEEELAQENKSYVINSTDQINTDKDDDKSVEKDEEISNEETGSNEDPKPTNSKKTNTVSEEETTDEDKIKAFGELLGKKNHWYVMSQEEWVDKCRTQRISEFGPVYDNFTNAGFYKSDLQDVNEQLTHKELDNTEIHNNQESNRESNANLQNHDNNDSTSKEADPVAKDIDSNNQIDKDALTEYNVTSKNSTGYVLPETARKSPSNPATSLSNPLSSQSLQATISYPLSHLSSNYSQNVYSYSESLPPEQHKLPCDASDIPLPGEDNVTSSSDNISDNSIYTSKHEELPQGIDEDNIMAGLKYLRERFEESYNK
ncbi:coiled-coil domain-containing protein 174 [Linepithema humile]|uniref:coiled-coil domain-containing protein 174 n=1 Tax=Linepithema humile TaxID=83485 RepID=UPI000623AC9D|nr:PREDICTED: coiled-coil domain-containing protein 174 [Linepithema humile]